MDLSQHSGIRVLGEDVYSVDGEGGNDRFCDICTYLHWTIIYIHAEQFKYILSLSNDRASIHRPPLKGICLLKFPPLRLGPYLHIDCREKESDSTRLRVDFSGA